MDMLGHVNNTVYFRYMEQARIEWLYSHLEGRRLPRRARAGDRQRELQLPVCRSSIRATSKCGCTSGEPGRTSVGSFYEIFTDGKAYADGAAKIVWIDSPTGGRIRCPSTIAAPLRAARLRRRRDDA